MKSRYLCNQKISLRLVALLAVVLCLASSCDFAPDAFSPVESQDSKTNTSQTSDSTRSSGTVRVIDAQTAYGMMQDGEEYVLLDVRTEEEFEQGHIQGALLMPYDEINVLALESLPDYSARILLYCRSGRRSAIAAETLADLGYTDVYDFGGINSWPYEVVS